MSSTLKKAVLIAFIAKFMIITAGKANAEKGLDVPTFFFNLGGGLTTYKSEAVKSNDTSFSFGYGLGVFGGRTNNFGMYFSNELNTTDFVYADSTQKSKVITSFQDTLIRYRLGPFYIGPAFTQMLMTTTRQDTEYLDFIATGIGFHTGLRMTFKRESIVFLEVLSASSSATKEAIQDPVSSPVSVGARTDIHLGGIIKLTRDLVDMQIGYKQRTYAISVGGESFTETVSFTWIGFGLNLYF
ncbi:MAG: hypothetical protein AB8G05_13430 [Oligoflexales bacterium]